jgi:hypothetical protein
VQAQGKACGSQMPSLTIFVNPKLYLRQKISIMSNS